MMRPIYWGTVLTIAGICSSIIFSYIAFLEGFLENHGRILLMPYQPMPSYYIPLIYVARFMIYFNLPLAIAIEAYLYLKGRKGESKGDNQSHVIPPN